MKLVINACYGGFGLSHEAILLYLTLKGFTPYWKKDYMFTNYGTQPDFMAEGNPGYFSDSDIPRDDPVLLQVIAELGKAASGQFAKLEVIEVPDSLDWQIEEYDGVEHIVDKHRCWP